MDSYPNLSLEECHSKTLFTITQHQKSDTNCVAILPFPKEMKLAAMVQYNPDVVPQTFRFKTNYREKLDGVTCHSIFSRYTTLALRESISLGTVIKPRFMVAAMKTNIQMINNTNAFKITNQEFDTIQHQTSQLPIYFNWMDNDEITRPFNQGLCGSCWAVSAANCLSDVFVVSKKVNKNPNLSTTYILSCMPQGQCDGGDPALVANDISQNGIPSSVGCMDYSWCSDTGCGGDPLKHFNAGNINQYVPPCQCNSNAADISFDSSKKYFSENPSAICIPPKLSDFNYMEAEQIKYYLGGMYGNIDKSEVDLSKKSVKDIQNLIKYSILTNGPVVGGFHVFKNFFKGSFKETNDIYVETCSYGGIPGIDYDDIERDWVGSHAVVVVGWGQDTINDETVDYWVVRNSWGTSWGKQGLWKMAMYGNDPTKKYQNRASQFEYPSIVSTENGIGITGGMIIYKAGKIEVSNGFTTSSSSPSFPTSVSPNVVSSPIQPTSPNQITISPSPNEIKIIPSPEQVLESPPTQITSSPIPITPSTCTCNNSPPLENKKYNTNTTMQSTIGLLLFICFLYALYIIYSNQNDTNAMLILKTFTAVLLLGLLFQLLGIGTL